MNSELVILNLYLKHIMRHFQTALNCLFIGAILLFIGGLSLWPFYQNGWKFTLSSIPMFLLFWFVDQIFKSMNANFAIENEKALRQADGELFFELMCNKMKTDAKFVKKYKFSFPEYLVDISSYTDDQIAQTLIGQTINIDGTNQTITRLDQAKYYLKEILETGGLDRFYLINGKFKIEDNNNNTNLSLKSYILKKV